MKWVKVPTLFKYEKDDGQGKKAMLEKTLDCAMPAGNPVEIYPHPEIVGRSILVTQFGIKDVFMAPDDLEGLFSANG